jgi:hypothetical protein
MMDPEIRARHDQNRADLIEARANYVRSWEGEDATRKAERDAMLAKFDAGLEAHDAMTAAADGPPVATPPVVEPAPVEPPLELAAPEPVPYEPEPYPTVE